LVKDGALAVMLLSGLLSAVLSASSSVAHEVRSGTALAVLANPVSRLQFLIAKYLGLAGALAVLTYVNTLAALLASRMAFDAYGDADELGLGIYFLALAIGYGWGGFTNFFLRRPFVADAVLSVVGMVTVAFVVINCFDQHGDAQTFAQGVDWRLLPASILILFALWILAGLALACSTRWEMIPTLAICSGLFLIGLMSDYLFGRPAVEGGSWWASILYTLAPNWQIFWLADALEGDKVIPWGYVARASGYLIAYLGATLALALFLFEDRELN
jgi:ABC-type transport system involved in multi-copper enzyme maturation permease subunit